MSEAAFEGFPAFVQVTLPAPSADVIQRALRIAADTLIESTQALPEDIPDNKLQIHEAQKLIGQFDILAEFFDDVAVNPEGYPVRGGFAAAIKRRQRQWTAMQPKKPRRKKGQSRRAYEARVARWSVKRQEEVKAYNEAANALIIADLPVTQMLVDAIIAGTTVDEIKDEIEKQQREYEEQEKKIADMVAQIESADGEHDENEKRWHEGEDAVPPKVILPYGSYGEYDDV